MIGEPHPTGQGKTSAFAPFAGLARTLGTPPQPRMLRPPGVVKFSHPPGRVLKIDFKNRANPFQVLAGA